MSRFPGRFPNTEVDSDDLPSNASFESVESDELTNTGEAHGLAPLDLATFQEAEFIGEPFESATFDPEVIHKSHFDDEKWRVVYGNNDVGETRLVTTEDFDSYTQVAADIIPDQNGTGQVAGIEQLTDGTWVFFSSTDSNTDLYTGPSLTELSLEGQVVPEPDGGTYYDEANGTIHYFPEDTDNQAGVSSLKLSHWTISDDDLLNATQQSDAIDATGTGWKTGDPEVIQLEGVYYMFFDVTNDHPDYRIGVAHSTDLYNWTIDSTSLTTTPGGDLTVVRRDNRLEGFMEYAGDDNANIGQFVFDIIPRYTSIGAERISPTGDHLTIGSGNYDMARFIKSGSESVLEIPTAAAFQPDGFRIARKGANESIGMYINNDGDALFESDNIPMSLGVKGSGQKEMRVEANRVSFGKFINLSPQASPPSSPSTNDIYLDDGSNTADGNEGFRRYDGSTWVDIG